MAKTKLADWSRACTELKTLPTSGNLITWTSSVEKEASEEAHTAQHCSTIRIKMWEWQCMATTLCLMGDDGLKHIDSLLKSKYTAKDMGLLGFEESDVKSLRLKNRVFRVVTDQTGQYLDIELDLRHAPLIISESRCNTNTKTVSTPRE